MWKSPMENSFPHFAPRPDHPRNRPDMSPQQQQNQHQLQQQYHHHHHRQLPMQMIPPHSGAGGVGGYLPPPQSSNNTCGNHQQFVPNSVVATQHQPHMNSSSLEPPHMNAPSNVATGIPVVPQHSQNFPQQQQQQMTLKNNSSNGNGNGISISPQQQVVLNQAFSLVTSIQNPTVLFHVSSFLQLMHNLLQATPQTNNIPQGGFPSQNSAAVAAAPPLPPTSELGSQNGSCFQPGANFPAKFPAQNPSTCSEDNMVVPNQFQIPNQLNPMCSPVSLNPMFPFTKSSQANGMAEILPNNMCWQGAGLPPAQQNHGQLQQHQMPQQGRLSGSQVPQSDSSMKHLSSPHQGKKPDCHGADAVQPVNGKVNNGPFNQQFSSNGNFKNGPSRFQKQNERSKDPRSSLDALHNKNSFQALNKGNFSEASGTNMNRKMKNRERNHDLQCSPLKRMRILKTSELSGENKQWREERKRNYPTDLNIQRKAEELQQKLAGGELIDEDAKKRKQRLREILAKQAELGIEVADIPAQYLTCDGANKDSDDMVEKVAKLSQNSSNDKIKKGPKVCYLFQKGRCKNGRRCRFLHERKSSSLEQDPPALQSSTRKPTLLEKLLEKDIKMERSHLLQVFRFMVNNSFFTEWPNKPLKFFQWSKEPPTTEPQKDAEKRILSHLQPISSGSDNTANNTEQASSDSEDMQEKNAIKKRSSSVDNSKGIDTTGKSLDEDGCAPKSAAGEDSSSSEKDEDVEEGEILDHEHEKQ